MGSGACQAAEVRQENPQDLFTFRNSGNLNVESWDRFVNAQR